YEVVRLGSRSEGSSRCRPQAWALSTYAVAPVAGSPAGGPPAGAGRPAPPSPATSTHPSTGRPSGSTVRTGTLRPPVAAWSTSRNPGPPSASGRGVTASPGAPARHPSARARAASTAESVPANLSGHTTTRIGPESARSQTDE